MNLAKEIEYLNNSLLHMADLVINNLNESFKAYLHYDQEKQYYINDDVVDNQERMIEEECLHILLRERPFASDLRRVSGILKLVGDLERLGDHAEDVLEFSLKLENTEKHNNEEIELMIQCVTSMVKDSIDAYIKNDISLAQSVIERDDSIDKMYSDIIEKIVLINQEAKCSSSFAVYTTLVVKYIERIADHAVNIAEWVIYILSGFHKDKRIV